MSVYRAISWSVSKKTEKRERRIVIRDHSYDPLLSDGKETFAIDWPEESELKAREVVELHLETVRIKVLKSHTWVKPHGLVFLTTNLKTSIAPDA